MARRGRAGAAARESSTTASSSDDGDQDYLDSLTRAQVLEIDAAFDEFAGDEEQQRAAKRRKAGSGSNGTKGDVKGKGKAKVQDEDTAMGGGFILEDDDATDAMGGGFLPEEDDDDAGPSGPSFGAMNDDNASKPGYILLESIPRALELLGLDGDDPSILSIFENASEEDDDGNSIVKRKNFMRVTAILVTQRDEDKELDAKSRRTSSAGKKVHSGGGRRRAVRLDVDEDMDEHDDSDPLVLSSDEEDEDDPDNEDSDPWADEDDLDGAFGKGREPSPASTRRTTRSVADSSKLASLPSGSSPPAAVASSSKSKIKGKGRADEVVMERKLKLSSKQEEECERMFQQFFQSTDKSKNRSISIDEIRYVATLLNEKLSDADAIEMLEYATSTKDKRVNLDAFSRIMVDCKAV